METNERLYLWTNHTNCAKDVRFYRPFIDTMLHDDPDRRVLADAKVSALLSTANPKDQCHVKIQN